MAWKRLARKTVYKTPYIEVLEDEVEINPGVVADSYSLVRLKDGVVIVATDEQNRLIVIDEYKYGVNQVLSIVPCGALDSASEDPVEAALRELKEETGYTAERATVICRFYEFPSKMTHVTFVVRVWDARKTHEPEREVTESIERVRLMSKEAALSPGAFADASSAAAILWTLAQE